MASPAPPVLPDSNQDRGGKMIAIYWAETSVAIIIVALRFYARRLQKSLGADDWLMLVALGFNIVLTGFVTQYALLGGTKHLTSLTPSELTQCLKWNYIFQCWGIFAGTPTKAAIAMLIIRVMNPLRGWRFWSIIATVGLLALFNTLDSIFTYVQCRPAAALWDKSITHKKCWDPSVQTNFSIFIASFWIFVDVFLALMPITIIMKLNINLKKRIWLCILLGLGLFAAVSGIIKTTYLANLSARSDFTWDTYDLVIWAGTENFVIIFCGCVPTLKVLWERWVTDSPMASSIRAFRSKASGHSYLVDLTNKKSLGVGKQSSVKSDETPASDSMIELRQNV